MKAATIKSLFLLAFFCFASTVSVAQDEVKTTEFTELTGKVVDSNNEPIEKFKIKIVIYDYTEGGWQETPKEVRKWDGEFEDGEFKFDLKEPIEIRKMAYISRSVTAEGYLETNRNAGWTQLSEVKKEN